MAGQPPRAAHPLRPPRRLLRLLAGAVVLGALVWIAGFLWFVSSLPADAPDPERRTDAIVVLTGGSGRVGQGLRLLAQKRAKKLFVSGVYRGVELPQLLELAAEESDAVSCCVSLGYKAHSTLGNAIETAEWIEANDFRSLRLVTAAYHMPRSLLEFRRQMPQVEIVPHPVFPDHVKQEAWWRWPGSAQLLMGEYSKFMVAWLRAAVMGGCPMLGAEAAG